MYATRVNEYNIENRKMRKFEVFKLLSIGHAAESADLENRRRIIKGIRDSMRKLETLRQEKSGEFQFVIS